MTTLSPPILPAHHCQAPQGSRAGGSFPLPPSPAEGCCAHCQGVLPSTGQLSTPSGRLGPCKLTWIGRWINICYWLWPNEMSVSSTANWSSSSVLQMSYCLCILPEMIKRRKQPPVLPGSPKGDTLQGRERETQFKASRWQQGGLSLGHTAEMGEKCQKTLQAALQPDLTWSRKSITNNNRQL